MQPNVELIAYQPSFLDPYLEWRIQPLSIRHNPLQTMSREEIAAILESEGSILSDLSNKQSYRWFIQWEDTVVGSVSLKNISHTMKYGELLARMRESSHPDCYCHLCMKGGSEGAIEIESAQAQFEQWRKTRQRRSAIPDGLWSMAIGLARREGVNRIAQQLHLDAGKLKRLLVAADSGKRKRRRQPGFVELAPMPTVIPGCMIEFESAGGSKMRIHWEAGTPPDWKNLLLAWRDAER